MKFQTRKTTEFFSTDYVNYSSYDNLRKIGSLVDGQKNAARKILWYVLQKNQKSEIKVSQLDSKVAESEEYLHGSMAGVIVNLAQDYVGTNNINMLQPEGNFGTRLVPEASAPRYIYTNGSKEMFKMFNLQDTSIIEQQVFEGHQIEPKFLLPELPLLLINGSEGISSGFAQKILPRNPEKIKEYQIQRLQGNKATLDTTPFFRGFTGTVQKGEASNKWVIKGDFVKKANKVYIKELPIGYNLKSYIKVLDKLEDDKKIVSYDDLSENGFDFVVSFNRKVLDGMQDSDITKLLKLEKTVSENYTVMNHLNQVQVFESVQDIFDEYYKIKLVYLQKRKDHLVKTITENIKLDVSKYTFIKSIQDEVLIITKRPTKDILNDLENIPKILKVNDSFDYLMNMNISSLTEERMKTLVKNIKAKKAELDLLKSQTIEMMWLNDLKK